jgi:hypothetical protein
MHQHLFTSPALALNFIKFILLPSLIAGNASKHTKLPDTAG